MAASISGTNPIVITSGMLNTQIDTLQSIKVKTVYWFQPDLSSTSSLVITKGTDGNGPEYIRLKAEVSGQSQTVKLDQWFSAPFINCVPTGTLYIYTH